MAGEFGTVLNIVVLYPDLLGTYGDVGNGLVLAERARRRDIEVTLSAVELHDDVPAASIYLLGGGEDGPQRLACDLLVRQSFASVVRDGACVVAVCAGLQILGRRFSVEGSAQYDGLGLVGAETRRGVRRSVGPLAVRVNEHWLVGFENHGGTTILDPGTEALGTVARGRGNDGALDGYRGERIWATYAHGPALAMNPWLADQVLETALGHSLDPLATVADQLHAERCSALKLGPLA